MKKLGLLPKIILGIITGIIVGLYLPTSIGNVLFTFSSIFSEILGYVIPLIIIGFIVPGIAELGSNAGKLLGITAGIAYISTVAAGIMAYFISSTLIPRVITDSVTTGTATAGLESFLHIEIPPLMGVMTALVTAFVFGLGINYLKNEKNKNLLFDIIGEFRTIVVKIIEGLIIPFLPFYIAGIFADMAASGEAFSTLSVFGKVFVVIILMHVFYLAIQFFIAGTISGKNPFVLIKNMLPAYTTAVGTMSSAASIPVTLKSTKENGVSEKIADFVVPLSATIHLAGSTITLVSCSVAVSILAGTIPSFSSYLSFIMILGVSMVAAPGVPGGAVMVALGLLGSMLGFTEAQQGLMMALYLAQDGFGTACNVTGDGAIAIFVDSIAKKLK